MTEALLSKPWFDLLEEEMTKPYFIKLKEQLRAEYNSTLVFPKPHDIFKALQLTPPDKVKVIFLTQDPYIGSDNKGTAQAHGLCFSTLVKETPFSLRMIFRELDRDIIRTENYDEFRGAFPNNDLTPWANEGVLLLNSILTVRAGVSNSHAHLGWQTFTGKILQLLWEDKEPKAFVLFGSDAKKMLNKYDFSTSPHYKLEVGHPASGAHSTDKFSGNNLFSKVNYWLKKQGIKQINWRLDGKVKDKEECSSTLVGSFT